MRGRIGLEKEKVFRMIRKIRIREKRQLEFLGVFIKELYDGYREKLIKEMLEEYERLSNEMIGIEYLFVESEQNEVFWVEYDSFDIDMSCFLSMFEVEKYTGKEYGEEELELIWECMKCMGRSMVLESIALVVEQLELVGFELEDFSEVIELGGGLKVEDLTVLKEIEDGSDNIFTEGVDEDISDLEDMLEEVMELVEDEDLMEDYATMDELDVEEEWELEDLRNVEYADDGVERKINWGEVIVKRMGLWKKKLPRLNIRIKSPVETYEWLTFWDSMIIFCRAWWVRVFLLIGFIPGVIDMYPHYYNLYVKYVGQSYRMYNKYYHGVDYVVESFQDKQDLIILSCNVIYGSMIVWLVYVLFKFERFGTFFRSTMEYFGGGGTYFMVLSVYVNYIVLERLVKKMDRELDGAWKSYIKKIVRNVEPYVPGAYRNWWGERASNVAEGMVSLLLLRWIPETPVKNELTERFSHGVGGVEKFKIDGYEVTGQHPFRYEMWRCKENYNRIRDKVLGYVKLPEGFIRNSIEENARDKYRWRLKQRYYYSRLKGVVIDRERKFEERIDRQYNYYPDYYYLGGYIGNSIRLLDEMEVYDKVISPYYRKMVKFISEVFVEEPYRVNELRDWYDAHKMIVPYYPWNEKLRRVWQKEMLVMKYGGERSIRYDYWYQENVVYPFLEELNKVERRHLKLVGKRGRSKSYRNEFLDDLIQMGAPKATAESEGIQRKGVWKPIDRDLEELNNWKEFIADTFFAREYTDLRKFIESKWFEWYGKFVEPEYNPYLLLETRRRRSLYRWRNEINYGPVRYGSKVSMREVMKGDNSELAEENGLKGSRVVGEGGFMGGKGMMEGMVGLEVRDENYGNVIRFFDNRMRRWLQYEGKKDLMGLSLGRGQWKALGDNIVEGLKTRLAEMGKSKDIRGELKSGLKDVNKMLRDVKKKEKFQKFSEKNAMLLEEMYSKRYGIKPNFYSIYNYNLEREELRRWRIQTLTKGKKGKKNEKNVDETMRLKVRDWIEESVSRKPSKRFSKLLRDCEVTPSYRRSAKVDKKVTEELVHISMGLWAEETRLKYDEVLGGQPKLFNINETTILTKEEFISWYYMRRRSTWLANSIKAARSILELTIEQKKNEIVVKRGKEKEIEGLKRLMEVMGYLEEKERRLSVMDPNEGPGFFYYNKPRKIRSKLEKSEVKSIEDVKDRIGNFWRKRDKWERLVNKDSESIDRVWLENRVLGRKGHDKNIKEEEVVEEMVNKVKEIKWEYGGFEKVVKMIESVRDRLIFDEIRMCMTKDAWSKEETVLVERLSMEGKAKLQRDKKRDNLQWVNVEGMYPWTRESVMIGDYSYRGGPYSIESAKKVMRIGSGRKMECWSTSTKRYKDFKLKRRYRRLIKDEAEWLEERKHRKLIKNVGKWMEVPRSKRLRRGRKRRANYVLERAMRRREETWLKENELILGRGKYRKEEEEDRVGEWLFAAPEGRMYKMDKRLSKESAGGEKYMEKLGRVSREGRIFSKMKKKRYDYYHWNNNLVSEYYTVGREYWMPSKLYLEDVITDADKIDREIILYEFFRFIGLKYEWPLEVIFVSAVSDFDIGVILSLIL